MGKPLAILLMTLAVSTCLKAEAVDLDLATPPCEWKPVLQALASNQPVKAGFEESRTNPFHKRPRRFKGEIFWHPDHGLSLQYHSPSELKINVLNHEIILYRSGEAPRQLEIDAENPALGMFFRLFDWDADWMDAFFAISGELDASGWKLQLRPTDDETRRKLSRIDLQGSGEVLQAIRLDFPGGREVDIRLFEQDVPWQPAADDLKKQFVTPDDQD